MLDISSEARTYVSGPAGPVGQSAYQTWLAAGNHGSEAKFLASLAGKDGRDGTSGAGALVGRAAGVVVANWRAVYVAADNSFRLADPQDLTLRGRVVGIVAVGGGTGSEIIAQSIGDLRGPNGGFAAGATLFVGPSGTLVATPPASGWRQIVGTVVAPDHIVVALGEASIVDSGEDAILLPDGGYASRCAPGGAIDSDVQDRYVTPGENRKVVAPLQDKVSDLTQRVLSPYDFGAVSDAVIAPDGSATASLSITENTTRLQRYLDACRDLDVEWLIPAGDWLAHRLTVYTPGRFLGRLLTPNDGLGLNADGTPDEDGVPAFAVAPLPGDITTIPLSEVKSWTGCTRGSQKIGGLTGRKNQYVTVLTEDQMLVDRRDKDNSANPPITSTFLPIYMGEGFLVDRDDGHIANPLIEDWDNRDLGPGQRGWQSGTFRAIRCREPIAVTLPDIVLVGPGRSNPDDAAGRRVCILVSRSNTECHGGSMLNLVTDLPPLQAVATVNCCNVTYRGTHVLGLGVLATQYGFNHNLTSNVTVSECSAIGCRRGWDATRGKGGRIIGGLWPDGIGVHYAVDTLVCGGAKVSATNTSNPVAFAFAGGDVVFRDVSVFVKVPVTRIFEIRPDIYKGFGKVHFFGCDITFDCGDEALVTLLNLRGPARNTGYDTGIVSEMPNSILMDRSNTIRLTGRKSNGTLSNAKLLLLDAFNDWDDVQSESIRIGGQIHIDPLILYDNPDPLPGSSVVITNPDGTTETVVVGAGDPKTNIRYVNPRRGIGGNYRMTIGALPDLGVEIFCDRAGPKAIGRVDLEVTGVRGGKRLSVTPGGCRDLLVDDRTGVAVTFVRPPFAASFPLLGDEQWRGFDSTRALASPATAPGRAALETDLSAFIGSLPKTNSGLAVGRLWNNAGAITRVEASA